MKSDARPPFNQTDSKSGEQPTHDHDEAGELIIESFFLAYDNCLETGDYTRASATTATTTPPHAAAAGGETLLILSTKKKVVSSAATPIRAIFDTIYNFFFW